jgi:HAD superfamily hydrolase (TIGR01509 family)
MLDLDGTLIDTSQLYLQGVPMVVRRHLGISIQGREILPMWGQHARRYFRHFARLAGREDDALIDAMYADFSEYYNTHHNQMTPIYPGVEASLKAIGGVVLAVGVVTTRPTSRSAPVLRMPWVRHIDFFVWGDQVSRNKPHPDGLEAAIQARAVNNGACVYVGDNPHDIQAARNCSRPVISVAALWGTMDKAAMMAAKPDLAFETFTSFAQWVIGE